MEQARQIWTEITKGPAGEKAHFWVEYIYLEKMFGDTKHLKKLFPRALAKTMDFPSMVGDMWIQFEREEGSLDSFEFAEKEVKLKVAKLSEEISATTPAAPQPNSKKSKDKQLPSVERKRKHEFNDAKEEPVFKKPMLPAAVSPSTSN